MTSEYRIPDSRSTPESRARFDRIFRDEPAWHRSLFARLFGQPRAG